MKKFLKLLIPYITSVIGNVTLFILNAKAFPYLFGHCNSCLFEDYTGIDFTRDEKVLGTFFDANDIRTFLAFVLLIVASILTIKIAKKQLGESKIKRYLYNAITIFICFIQFIFIAYFFAWA